MIWMMKSAWPMHWCWISFLGIFGFNFFFFFSSFSVAPYTILTESHFWSLACSLYVRLSIALPSSSIFSLYTHSCHFWNVSGGVGETRAFISFRFVSFVCLHARTLISVLNISCPTVGTKGRCKKIFNWFVMCFLFLWLHYVVVSSLLLLLLCFDFTLYTTACVWNLFAFSMLADVCLPSS